MSLSPSIHSLAQKNANYDENKVREYQLPDVLTLQNGNKITNTRDWEKKRRPEILSLFEQEVYGRIPNAKLQPFSSKVIEESDEALNNTALRKQIAITFKKDDKEITINVLVYLPKNVENPPIFIGYNFYGNQSIIADENVILTRAWIDNNAEFGIDNHQANDASRGKRANRWPVEKILAQGFGLATIYYGDVDPDKNDFSDGIQSFFYKKGQTAPADNEWGAIAAWSWGLSRVMDYFKNDQSFNDSKYILMGHSRLGKAALWAGATDERFDIVISNDSGCGGAALSRRNYGETVAAINQSFPYWFANNFEKYNLNETNLPVDQHMLIALIAPRPVYIASAESDQWADPKGEYLSGHYAGIVYSLYGKTGLPSPTPPSVNQPVHNDMGYHIRTGIHDVTDYDWEQYMVFSKKHLM